MLCENGYSKILEQDLKFVHQTMLQDFPGFRIDHNYQIKIENVFIDLLNKSKKCLNQVDYIKIMRKYFAAYEDVHLFFIDSYDSTWANIYEMSTGQSSECLSHFPVIYYSVGIKLKLMNSRFFIDAIDHTLISDPNLKVNDELILFEDKIPMDILNIEILPFFSISVKEASKYRYAKYLFHRFDRNEECFSRCVFRNKEREYVTELKWNRVNKDYFKEMEKKTFKNIYTLENKCYGKLISLKSLGGYNIEEIEQLNQFVNDAKKLANEKNIILDLRGNGGGRSIFGTNWIKNLYGVIPQLEKSEKKCEIWASQKNILHYKNFYAALKKKGQMDINDRNEWNNIIQSIEKAPDTLVSIDTEAEGVDLEHYKVDDLNEFKGNLSVIIDWGVFSSTEIFVQELSTLPRVKLYGLPTDASSLFGDLRVDATPSGRIFSVPTKIFYELFGAREPKKPIIPHIIIDYDIEAEINGRDSILEAVERIVMSYSK